MSVSHAVPEHSYGLRRRGVRQERDGIIRHGPRTKRAGGRDKDAVRETELLRRQTQQLTVVLRNGKKRFY